MAKTLHLVIPGLFGPASADHGSTTPIPPAPVLTRLLNRAEVQPWPARCVEETLFQLFGLQPVGEGCDLPVAAITRLADGGDVEKVDGSWWLRADPVHLDADLKQVLLSSAAQNMDIQPHEAQHLVAECNTLLQADGLQLEAPVADRWYMRLTDDPGLRTEPLPSAVGRDINTLLPHGTSSHRWRALLTELQMLLHSSTVNAQRQARGQQLINSVWFWGGGFLPRLTSNKIEQVFATEPAARGLAFLAGVEPALPPATASEWQAVSGKAAESLVVLDATHNDRADNAFDIWVDHVVTQERCWFSPCLTLLTGKALDFLHIYPGNSRFYTVTRRRLRQFWRRLRPWPAC